MPSTQWKLRTIREKWYAGETISACDRPGKVTVTPIQLAVADRRLGERRRVVRPHLVREPADAEKPRRAELHPENIAT